MTTGWLTRILCLLLVTGCPSQGGQGSAAGGASTPGAATTASSAAAGGKGPVVPGVKGEPVTVDAITLELTDDVLRFVDVCSERGCKLNTKEPFYVVQIRVTNRGKTKIRYAPGHHADKKARGHYPFLTDTDGIAFTPVVTTGFTLAGQAPDEGFIEAGEAITDRYVYANPGRATRQLLWEFPARIFGSRGVITFRLPYALKPPVRPQGAPLDQKWTFDDVQVRFKDVKVSRAHLRKGKEEACSRTAYLQVYFQISNQGKKPFSYDPAFNEKEGDASHLFDPEGNSIRRAFYNPGIRVTGQIARKTRIRRKRTITDMVMFDRPPDTASHVVLELGTTAFGRAGVLRVQIDAEHFAKKRILDPCKR